MHIHTDKKTGFTLIELLIAIVLASIIAIAVLALLRNQRKNYIAQQAMVEADEAVSKIHGELLDKIRLAGYMIPNDVPAIMPFYVGGGPDSVRVASNYDNFVEPTVLKIDPGDDYIFTKCPDGWRYWHGTNLMVRKDSIDAITQKTSIISYWSPVDTAIAFTASGEKYILFELSDGDAIEQSFPAGSRVSTFNTYTYRVIQESGNPPYFGVDINEQGEYYHVAEVVEDLTFTYEMKNDTTERTSLPTDSLDFIFAVNVEVETRSVTEDMEYTDPIYGDHYRRRKLKSQVVILNLAIDKR